MGVVLTSGPPSEGVGNGFYAGYAALPDADGTCAAGLEKIRSWVARPYTIEEGSLDGRNPPTNFINHLGSLNDTTISAGEPENLVVTRQRNKKACEGNHSDPSRPLPGSCKLAEFAEPEVVQKIGYIPLTPVVCAVPANLIQH